MHFEILTEDKSGGRAMDILFPKILGDDVTYNIHPYKGIGRIPKGLRPKTDSKKRILLDQLPRILQGYANNPNSGIIIVICDLDNKDKQEFLLELSNVLNSCNPIPKTLFCFAVEEFEAWYLGDIKAIIKAYPNAKYGLLSNYINDSICGTWELLADAIYKGGHIALIKKGWQAVGELKLIWANVISPNMDTDDNKSPSFNDMLSKLHAI